MKRHSPFAIANIRYFIGFRVLFNCRFYYPVFTILFLDYGLSIEQFALLNSVWAASIFLAEVPSGALADLIGRKRLLIITSVLMILEMALLSFVPLGNMNLVFWAFLLNRIFSGLAEAMASGADEALAYDSLQEEGIEDHWPHVLSVMMRIQAAGTVITMSLGALLYDPTTVNAFFDFLGQPLRFDQQITMRFPLYLTLVLASLSCVTVLMMKETGATNATSSSESYLREAVRAFRLTIEAGGWILKTPFALTVILFAMGYDHILRMIITMNSKYFRIIELPEASFGFIGSAMALMGLFIPKVAEAMVKRYTPVENMLWLSALTLTALCGLAAAIPYWGLLPMALVPAGLQLTSFFTSHYLNRITDSSRRATVLSFKGMAFNLAYGFIGLAFAVLMNQLRQSTSVANPQMGQALIEDTAFTTALVWFIPYTCLLLIVAVPVARHLLRHRRMHRQKG